ncbi:hypothetical protein LINPERHAP2_LOCUS8956 [Linum perenne]
MGENQGTDCNLEDDLFLSDESEDEGEDDPTCPTIRVPQVVKARIRKKWGNSLILRTLGKSFSYLFMTKRLQALWARKGRVEVWDIGAGHYVARFEEDVDYMRAMFEGPWLVGDHYVISEEWRPNFEPGYSQINHIRVWVRLPGLPLEYFDAAVLRILGDKLGTTIRVDGTTLLGSRGNYVRLCIEVDLHKPLVSKYRLNRRVRRVEYEGLHEICFQCGRYGHDKSSCSSTRDVENSGIQETLFSNPIFNKETERPELEDDFGPWMKAKKNVRRRKQQTVQKTSGMGETSKRSGSRFGVFTDEQPKENAPCELFEEGNKESEDLPVESNVQAADQSPKTKENESKLKCHELNDSNHPHNANIPNKDSVPGQGWGNVHSDQDFVIEDITEDDIDGEQAPEDNTLVTRPRVTTHKQTFYERLAGDPGQYSDHVQLGGAKEASSRKSADTERQKVISANPKRIKEILSKKRTKEEVPGGGKSC